MTLSSTALLKHQGDITLKDVVTEPQEILALFASKKQQDKGKLLKVSQFQNDLLISYIFQKTNEKI